MAGKLKNVLGYLGSIVSGKIPLPRHVDHLPHEIATTNAIDRINDQLPQVERVRRLLVQAVKQSTGGNLLKETQRELLHAVELLYGSGSRLATGATVRDIAAEAAAIAKQAELLTTPKAPETATATAPEAEAATAVKVAKATSEQK